MPVTLSDVAKAAGVSQATASRAIHGAQGRTVRPELRERVLAAAAELKYSADANAQAMARGKTAAIGLIVHDIADPYFSSIASGVARSAEDHALVVTLASTDRVHAREIAFIRLMQGQRARAIILAGGRDDNGAQLDEIAEALSEYRSRGGQVAVIGQAIYDSATVKIANFAGAQDLATALMAIGYLRFAILAGPKGHMTARDRHTGFSQAVQGAGGQILDQHTVHGDFSWQGGYDAMTAMIAGGYVGARTGGARTTGAHTADKSAANPHVDAVFAVSDLMALGAMAAVREHGLEVGTDVRLAGFDDISTLRDVTPGLTTVSLPLDDIGVAALDLALQGELDLETGSPSQDVTPPAPIVEIAGRVIIRMSTPAL